MLKPQHAVEVVCCCCPALPLYIAGRIASCVISPELEYNTMYYFPGLGPHLLELLALEQRFREVVVKLAGGSHEVMKNLAGSFAPQLGSNALLPQQSLSTLV